VPAAGGAPLLDAAAQARAVVLGVVREPVRLDPRSWIAVLEVRRGLSGPYAAGDRVSVAWEEPARRRPPRFAEGTRVLVALADLPGWSIWRERLGERDAVGVAREGGAFLRDPTEADVDGLARWLGLSRAGRDGPEGVAALAALVADASVPLAEAAVEHLAAVQDLAGHVAGAPGSEARASLMRALGDPGRPVTLRAAVAGLAGARALEGLRPALEAQAAPGGALAAAAVDALGRMAGGLPAARVRTLLARPEPGVRTAALRHAPPGMDPEPARVALAGDPDSGVRAAAVGALAEREGLAAWDVLAPRLDDPDDAVRGAAIRALGGLGAPAVPRLVERARGGDLDSARAPLLALALAGPDGRKALRVLAARHQDAEVRRLAGFLLGRPPDPHGADGR
jgi:HEAT repeat protein